jgi:hypothetical protein
MPDRSRCVHLGLCASTCRPFCGATHGVVADTGQVLWVLLVLSIASCTDRATHGTGAGASATGASTIGTSEGATGPLTGMADGDGATGPLTGMADGES